MNSLNIVISQEFEETDLHPVRQAAPGAVLRMFPTRKLADIPPDVLAQADVFYTGDEVPWPEAVPRLKWVQTHSAGVDGVIHAPLFAHGDVILTTAAGVHGINISEHVLMMMLAFAHRLHASVDMMRRRAWSADRMQFMPFELHGATVGLIGYGGIGRQIASRCLAFGMKVLVLRRSPPPSGDPEAGIDFLIRSELPRLMAESDFVVVAAPLTPDTYHLIDAAALRQMKPGAVLINISRGDVVDEPALIEALRDRRIAGAALDVFSLEPLPADSPLWRLGDPDHQPAHGRVVLTPHIAGITPNYKRRAAALFADNLRRYIGGQPLLNRVDFVRGY